MRTAAIHGFEMAHPGDASGLEAALKARRIAVDDIVCIMGKTEGNGLDNDHTRAYATAAILDTLQRHSKRRRAALEDRISLVLSGGTEGVTNPHMTVFTAAKAGPRTRGAAPSLGLARARGRALKPREIGSWAHAESTAVAVREAMAAGGFAPADVGYVLVKGALLQSDLHGSKPVTRGASALGVAVALGEVSAAAAKAALHRDRGVFCTRACVTPAIDVDHNEVLVFGNGPGWRGGFRVGHAVFDDVVDGHAVTRACAGAGIEGPWPLGPGGRERIAAIVIKGETSRTDRIRGRRHTGWHDSDVHALRHFRAAMSGLVAGLTGETRMYIAAGAEHQGPEGGGTIAVFGRVD